MGYNTKFTGHIELSRELTLAEAKIILEANEDPDGIEGPHPKSYMQWVPDQSLQNIVYDGNEKFYNYTEWLEWLMALLAKWRISASGQLYWQGESVGDTGTLSVLNNAVQLVSGTERQANGHSPLTLAGLGEIALQRAIESA